MKSNLLQIIVSTFLAFPGLGQPLQLHPHNKHYFEYHGRPLILISSAEHYGAILNLEFDYKKYLKTLHEEGMNYTRIFTGSYVEVPGSFGIRENTLSPKTDNYIAPWKRSETPGLFEGEEKFDLDQWDPDYFVRLHDFMKIAEDLDIIVEVTFFCATYQDAYWLRHPFHPENNINSLGDLSRKDFNTLKNPVVVNYQKNLIRKLVTELNRYDNIFFELCNEPWADNGNQTRFLHKTLIPKEQQTWHLWSTSATPEALAWQKELAQTFRNAENLQPNKHLLAQNYSNFYESLVDVDPNIDILNFHYAWPEAVAQNYGWMKPVGFDESGFAGTADSTYVQQAWAFMMSGGAIFNGLDYSFYVGREDGTGINEAPGGGSSRLRHQLKFLRNFLSSFNLPDMIPSPETILHSPGLDGYCLKQGVRTFLIYFSGRNQGYFFAALPTGEYQINAINPDTGTLLEETYLVVTEKTTRMNIPKLNRVVVSILPKQ